MSKLSEFTQCLVDKFVVSQDDADKFVKELFNIIRERLEKDKIVKVRGLGTFKLTEMSPRESIAINTGERIVIEGKYKFTFTPENVVRNRINSPFSQFESIDIDDDIVFDDIDNKYNSTQEPEPATTEPAEVSQGPVPEPETPMVEVADIVTPAQEEAIPSVEAEPPREDKSPQAEVEPLISPESESESQDNSECEELIRESVSHSRTIVHLLYWILALVAVGLLVVAGYFVYQLYTSEGESRSEMKADATSVSPAELAIATADTLKNDSPDSTATTSASTATTSVPTDLKSVGASSSETSDPQQATYNKDSRVRTGAYVITGLDTTVTVLAGQTFKGICKAYLGEGMECYVEVFNDGKKTVEAGDKIKIPKLKLKKRIKKR